jgi:hypothetical protein
MIWLSCVIVLLCVAIAFLVTEIGHRGILIERLEFEVKQLRSTLSTQTRQVSDAAFLAKRLQQFLNDVAMRLDMKWQNSLSLKRDGGDFCELEILESSLEEFCHKVLVKFHGKEDKGLNA